MNEQSKRCDVSTRSLTPMTVNEAKALVRRYLGSFPSLNLHDPEIYIADLCTVLVGYPLWAGQAAIEKVKDTIKFPAVRAEIKPVLEDQVRVHRYASEWERNAQQARIAGQKQLAGPKAPRPTYDELKAKYGPNWGINDPNAKPPPPSRDECRQKLVAQIGQEAFDAIPDAPPRPTGTWKGLQAPKITKDAAE